MTVEVEPEPIRVATYNIHKGVGLDGVFNLQRTGQVIRELAAQVVGLQEVYSSPTAGAPSDLDQLAEITGFTAVAGGIRDARRGRYGNALLTSLQVRGHNRIDLSVRGREPRGALEVHLRATHATIRVVVAHLGLAPWERREQSRRLVAALASTDNDADVTILLGDVNEWFTWGRPLRWLHRALGRCNHIATFPAILPLVALDRIWVRPRVCLRRSWRVWNPITRRTSDHLPLVADVMLPPR